MGENKNDFFDFDMDTNIFEKLENDKNSIKESSNNTKKLLNKKRKPNINSSWSYDNVLTEEKKIQKIKETKKIKELGLTNPQPKEDESELNQNNNNNINNNNIPLIEEEEKSEENPYFKDKFENALFAKGMSFSNFNLSKLIIKALSEMEYYTPTKVQEKVIPIALNGHDIFVNSETGSGKTACFLLPIVQRIILSRKSSEKKNKNEKNITNNTIQNQALIIVPTRELALQCNEMLSKFLKYIDLNFVFLCGGLSVENQMKQMKNKIPDIIITTPGRLLDLIYNNKNLSLEHVNILVLDEADKL